MSSNKIRFTAIGDVGADIYPSFKKKLPGGTALNSAIYAAQEGAEASVISAIGTDELSQIPLKAMEQWNIHTSQLEVMKGETDRVDIELDKEGRPEYANWELGVLANLRLNKGHQTFLATQHIAVAVHLPEIRALFDGFAHMNLKKTIKVADFTDLSEYNGDVSVIEKYIKQFDIVALSIDASEKDRLASFYDIAQQYKKMAIALMGKDGSAVYVDGSVFYQKALEVPVTDTTGAGDVYLSTYLIHYLLSQDIHSSMAEATEKASQVIQHVGAIQY